MQEICQAKTAGREADSPSRPPHGREEKHIIIYNEDRYVRREDFRKAVIFSP
jgi:hypothetical protein